MDFGLIKDQSHIYLFNDDDLMIQFMYFKNSLKNPCLILRISNQLRVAPSGLIEP